ncbi:MAG TPA: DUF305 domain-containing protein [Beijerinckiaceae bacterium]|jgi:uncharacterized protein (DUF305 family)
MFSNAIRRLATRTLTSKALTAFALAAGLSTAASGAAFAQHSGHHGHHGHHGHAGHGAAKSSAPKKKAPAKKRSSAAAGAHHAHGGAAMGHGGHRGHGASASDPASVREFKVAHAQMMRGMDLPYTGDADVDFRVQMIPHHQGAIDMARVAMRHAKDPWTRQLAEAVIVEQQREIAEMQAWLSRRGIAAPAGSQPRHLLTADSFRTVPEEPGTRAELRGQSWAPGGGIPAFGAR